MGVGPLHTKHSNSNAPGVRAIELARHSLQYVCKQFNVFGALGDDLSDVNEFPHISQVRKLSLIFDTNLSLYALNDILNSQAKQHVVEEASRGINIIIYNK